ncbi:MAG: hypothetical protein AB1725_10950 [Armatimonadota bacterium]
MKPAVHATLAMVLLGGGLAVLGVRLDAPLAQTLKPGLVESAPAHPFAQEWERAPLVRLATSDPLGGQRTILVRALRDEAGVHLLMEWQDDTKDLAFEGATYASERYGTTMITQEVPLARDELEVRFAPHSTTAPYIRLAEATPEGSWVWKSQWQRQLELNALETAVARYPRDYVDDYPFPGDRAYFPARAVENTAALQEHSGAVRWMTPPARGRFGRQSASLLTGTGEWKGDRWRVLIFVPTAQRDGLAALTPGRWDLTFLVADGRRGEGERTRGVSQPLLLHVPPVEGGAR